MCRSSPKTDQVLQVLSQLSPEPETWDGWGKRWRGGGVFATIAKAIWAFEKFPLEIRGMNGWLSQVNEHSGSALTNADGRPGPSTGYRATSVAGLGCLAGINGRLVTCNIGLAHSR